MRGLLGLTCLLSCLLWCLGTHAREPLTVIYDSGDTLPLAPYLPKRAPQEQITPQNKKDQLPFKVPITAPSMQPGKAKVTPKALRYLQRPLFLVGADQVSRDWLAQRREQLIELGAVGLLVEAKDRHEVEAVLAIAKGLRLVPASAEGFAAKLGLTHYPVLLSKEGWEQ